MESDSIVIKQFGEGSKDAFTQIFKAYYSPLVRYAFTILNRQDEAEDIVQQVFIALWEKRMQPIHTSLRGLLYKMVYNACLNRIKQLKVRAEYAGEIESASNYSGIRDTMFKNELEIMINEALDKLPEQCRRIFKMSRFEHKRYQEIADDLNLSIKTVENQIGKALKIMREELKDYLPLVLIFLNLN